jgi:2-dehydro-3-deoxyphosphogluconate aldolase/(4S)-4-hydroxy-2-oxoglutarate aldolase
MTGRNRSIRDFLALSPVIPVVTINSLDHAVPLARGLRAGGIRVIEITLRTRVAIAAMRAIATEVEDVLVAAGTVLRPQDLSDAAAAGASLAISPGATPELLATGKTSKIPYLPGVATPAEVMLALEHGYETLKFFPATAAGGIDMLKALHGPFPNVRFCPTGGITADNAQLYLDLPNVLCVGGSWLAPQSLLANGDWNAIESLARRAAVLSRKFA